MTQEVSLQKWIAVFLLIAAGTLSLQPVSSLAQQDDQSPLMRLEERAQQSRWDTQQLSGNLAVPLEGQLDPTEYVVGPGDVFSVFVGGPQPVSLTPAVSAEGDLVLPEVGGIPAAGRSLAEVKSAAQSALRERFENVNLDVSLQRPRTFYVHVAGAVPAAGRYTANPVARVSNIVDVAFLDTARAAVGNPMFEPSFRNITLIRQNGEQQSVDLERYYATGNTAYNPYLRGGDVISVPAYNPNTQSVRVDGALPFPGSYAYRPGDTVLDLLAIATGQSSPEDIERVRLTRQQEGAAADTMMLDVAAMMAGTQEPIPLRPLDHLFVPTNERSGETATIEGWVKYPGTYSIEPERTTAEDLVERAGGLRQGALEHGAYLLRGATEAERERTRRRLARIMREQDLPASAHPERYPRLSEQATAFQQTRLAELTFAERQYLSRELAQSRVPVNLTASGNEGEPVYLRDGDRLVVPRDRNSVLVTGQVNRPGYVRLRSSFNAEDYIEEAGGRTNLATQGYVIKAGTRRYVPLDEANVESGDAIFLNREGGLATSPEAQRVALQEEEARRNARNQLIRNALSAISTVATVALIVLRFNN